MDVERPGNEIHSHVLLLYSAAILSPAWADAWLHDNGCDDVEGGIETREDEKAGKEARNRNNKNKRKKKQKKITDEGENG